MMHGSPGVDAFEAHLSHSWQWPGLRRHDHWRVEPTLRCAPNRRQIATDSVSGVQRSTLLCS
eukprot:4636214-Amphidinium_carterae.3